MKIKHVIHTGNHNPVQGPELKITLETNETFTVWAEWLFEAEPKWDGNISKLVGLEVTEEWLEWACD
jgi:hypothetical protein